MTKPPYFDTHALRENERIHLIGVAAMHLGKTVGFITEKGSGKTGRYISKLITRFPGIAIIGIWEGPTKGTTLVKVGPPKVELN